MGSPLFLVDAFTHGPFTGNPAGVCLLEESADELWMQSLASELNQAETAFVDLSSRPFGLRWFTPKLEVDLCGHATLASAHVLFETGIVERGDDAKFQTRSGLLTCSRENGGLKMDFPAKEASAVAVSDELARALGFQPRELLHNEFDLLAVVESSDELRTYAPKMELIARLPVRGLCMTAPSSGHHDFESRFFAPGAGVPEDHATGSAHCMLAPYWARRLGKDRLTAYQASPRGALIECEVKGGRVLLCGSATICFKGEAVC